MPTPDTEATLIKEMTAIIRRAIALGSEETTARILRAATGEAAAPKEAQSPELRRRIAPEIEGTRKYPYGYVTMALQDAFKAHPNGIAREAVDTYINETLERNIDPESIRNGIKQFVRTDKIRRKGNLLIWNGP